MAMHTVFRFTTCSWALTSFAIRKGLGNGRQLCSLYLSGTVTGCIFMHVFHPYNFITQSTTRAEGTVQLDRYLKNSIKMGCLDLPSRKKGGEKAGTEQKSTGSNYNNTLCLAKCSIA